MSTKKTSHGGRRPGAGRPSRDNPKQSLTVRLEVDNYDWVASAAKASGVSKSALVDELIAEKRRAQDTSS